MIVDRGARGLWLIPLVVLSVFFVNQFSSPLNNWNIALLELTFCIGTLMYLGVGRVRLEVVAGLAVLVAVLTISNALAIRDGVTPASWQRVLVFVMHFVFALAVARWFSLVPQAVRWLVWSGLLAVFLYLGVLVWFWNQLEDPLNYNWFGAPPLFRHIRHVGYFLCVATVFASWAIFAFQGWRRWVGWVAYCVGMGMLLWSGGRGALIGSLMATAVLALRYLPLAHLRQWVSHVVAWGLALAGSALFAVNQKSLGWLGGFLRSAESESLNRLSSGRLGIWSYLAERAGERPWFGWGGEGFSAVWPDEGIIQGHNGFFQLLIEWGIVGTAWVLLVLGFIAVNGTRQYLLQRSNASEPLTLGVVLLTALLFLASVDGVLYHGTPFAFLMVGCGLLMAALCMDQVPGKAGRAAPECGSKATDP